MALLLKLGGNSQLTFRFYNVFMLSLLLFGIKLLIDSNSNNYCASTITLISLTIFYPIIIYTCYLYGTLSAVSFEVFGFWEIIEFIKKKTYRHAVISAFCFTFGAFMHQSALIGLLAGCLLLFININRNDLVKICIAIGIIISTYLLITLLINLSYSSITKCQNGNSLPATATIYMGITSTEGSGALSGPGSSDGSEMVLYQSVLLNRSNSIFESHSIPANRIISCPVAVNTLICNNTVV